MEQRLFDDIYNDAKFNGDVTAMLRHMYNNSKSFFQDNMLDFDDFLQEMWCELFEEKRFNPDKPWCMEAIKCNALDYIKMLRNRASIATFVELDDGEE